MSEANTPRELRIGPAGWSYADWAGIVYPARRPRGFSEPAYLAEFFDTIEINSSFYQPLRPAVCWQWLERVAHNPRFLFTAKLWQRFTHETGATQQDEAAMREGFDMLMAGEKLGAVLLQFPFSFHRTRENLAHLKTLLDRFRAYTLVVEVRHATWNHAPFYRLLAARRVGFCNIDQPLIARSLGPTERAIPQSGIGYVRLHGRRYDTWFTGNAATPPSERYNYLYTEKELAPWAARIEHVMANAGRTFVITNNHYQGKAVVNALQLIRILTRERVKVPEPLRVRYPELDRIASQPAQEPTLFPNPPR